MHDENAMRAAAAFIGANGIWAFAHPKSFDAVSFRKDAGRNAGSTRWLGYFMTSAAATIAVASTTSDKPTKKNVLRVLAGMGAASVATNALGIALKTDRTDSALGTALVTGGLGAWALARALKKD
ncbi:hypothetical protein HXX76_009893 [Chlamydomonas incerta]|uniref:Uncharacterized protein n=1 Tax=Chlamydomonas incerta TaxID=51695 RepID=A0A835SSA2_CHLIN|nr:hypothetical protein HXX76_009893 [Chlamydomonas incerta]|eukprot:KAG2430921.1 hypothetical protein HXX76_009893 [Chlamydomonas incerta]